MRKRPIAVLIYYNQNEYDNLCKLCKETGLPKSTVIRSLTNGCVPKQMPSADYKKLLIEFNAIGRNLNQLLVVARTQGYINTPELMKALDGIDF